MAYISSTFIAAYANTAKTLRIINSVGQVVFSLNVCNYQKSSVNGNNLNVVLEDNVQEYVLDFTSNTEAKQAMLTFKTAIDALRLNCNTSSSGGTLPVVTPIPISYAQYKTLQQANNLIAFQWYDVTDVSGVLLPSGTTIRLQPIGTDDFHPTGEVLNISKAKISIDSLTDDVLYYEKPDNRIILLNAKPSEQIIDPTCNNVIVKNKSTLIAVNSTVIEIESKSVVNLNGCNNIKVSNSIITLLNSNNVIIDDMIQDFSTLGFNLIDVTVNPYDSIGKRARANLTANKTLEAYLDPVEQVFAITGNNLSYVVILENKIPTANSDFRLKYFTNTGTGNAITIKNIDNSTIFVISDNQINDWVTFRWNKLTSLYEFVTIEYGAGLNGIPYLVASPTNNQTSFPLPTPAAMPTKLEMFINGQKKVYGLDYSYSSGSQSAIYTNRDFNIATTDEVEFVIY